MWVRSVILNTTPKILRASFKEQSSRKLFHKISLKLRERCSVRWKIIAAYFITSTNLWRRFFSFKVSDSLLKRREHSLLDIDNPNGIIGGLTHGRDPPVGKLERQGVPGELFREFIAGGRGQRHILELEK